MAQPDYGEYDGRLPLALSVGAGLAYMHIQSLSPVPHLDGKLCIAVNSVTDCELSCSPPDTQHEIELINFNSTGEATCDNGSCNCPSDSPTLCHRYDTTLQNEQVSTFRVISHFLPQCKVSLQYRQDIKDAFIEVASKLIEQNPCNSQDTIIVEQIESIQKLIDGGENGCQSRNKKSEPDAQDTVDGESVATCDPSLLDVGFGLAWIYLVTEVVPFVNNVQTVTEELEFHNVLPKLVITCRNTCELLTPAGFVGTWLPHENSALNCQVVRFKRNAEVYHMFVDYPRQLQTLEELYNKGKLSFLDHKRETDNFLHFLKESLKTNERLCASCIFLDEIGESADTKTLTDAILDRALMGPPGCDNYCSDKDRPFDERIEDDDDIVTDGVKNSAATLAVGKSCSKRGQPSSVIAVVTFEQLDRGTTAMPVVEPRWKLRKSPDCEEGFVEPTTNRILAALKLSAIIGDATCAKLAQLRSRNNGEVYQAKVVRNLLLFMVLTWRHSFARFIKTLEALKHRADEVEDQFMPEKNFAAVLLPKEMSSLEDIEINKDEKHSDSSVDSGSKLNSGDKLNVDEKLNLGNKPPDTPLPKEDASMKRMKIVQNILFSMIEEKKHLPYDFEVQLRKAVFDANFDVSRMRSKDGYTLLHSVVANSRPQFVLPLFRTGCWKSLRLLPVERGKGNEYEGRTAEDMATLLKLRKVQKEMDTCAVWEKSMNLIHVEARVGNFNGVKQWLNYSNDLHTELDSMQCSSLYWACIGGNLDIVKLLLLLKVDFTTVNARKETLLHAACMMGHHQLIEILVKECHMDLSAKDATKKTPLLRASENGDERCIARLLECGMRPELLGPLLPIAGHYGRIGLIRFIVEKHNINPQSKDEAGKSALLRSAEQGRIDVLRYLFSKGVNVAETDIRRRNVLHVSADGASKEVIEFVIAELKKRPDGTEVLKRLANARDKYIGGELCMLIRGKDKGRDSWHYVEVSRSLMDIFMKRTRGGTIDVAKYGTLLHSGWGADPDEAAAREIERRFETRRNANTSDDADVTPLHIAVFKDKLDVAEVLLDNGAEPNVRDKFGMTAMHIAAMRGNMGLIQKLLEHGAQPDALDTMVKTPADVAEDNEHTDVCNYLKGVKYVPVAQRFREVVLPNFGRLISAEHIRNIHEAGGDLRTHLINILRDLTVDINETLLKVGSGPVLEESASCQQ